MGSYPAGNPRSRLGDARTGRRAGTRQLAAVMRSLREEFDFPIFLRKRWRPGFDSVEFDLSGLLLEENTRSTRQAVEELSPLNPAVVVEGER